MTWWLLSVIGYSLACIFIAIDAVLYRFSPTSEQVKSAVVNVYIISRVIACLLGNKARLSSAKPTPASV